MDEISSSLRQAKGPHPDAAGLPLTVTTDVVKHADQDASLSSPRRRIASFMNADAGDNNGDAPPAADARKARSSRCRSQPKRRSSASTADRRSDGFTLDKAGPAAERRSRVASPTHSRVARNKALSDPRLSSSQPRPIDRLGISEDDSFVIASDVIYMFTAVSCSILAIACVDPVIDVLHVPGLWWSQLASSVLQTSSPCFGSRSASSCRFGEGSWRLSTLSVESGSITCERGSLTTSCTLHRSTSCSLGGCGMCISTLFSLCVCLTLLQ